MARIRVLFAWLVLLAVPLQGFAAASMLFCGAGGHAVVAEQPATMAGHAHHHVAGMTMDVSADTVSMPMTDVAASHHADTPSSHDADSHTCSVCAACGHAAAVVSVSAVLPPPFAPATAAAQPAPPLRSRAFAVPDKPPRG